MSCIGWSVNTAPNWEALAAIGTLMAVVVALLLPAVGRWFQKCDEKKIQSARAKDGATIMLPIVEEAVRQLRGMEAILTVLRNQRNYNPGDRDLVLIQAFDDLKSMLNYADALPENARRLLAQAVGWGISWNGLARVIPNPTHSNSIGVYFGQIDPLINILPALVKVFNELNIWTKKVGSVPSLSQ